MCSAETKKERERKREGGREDELSGMLPLVAVRELSFGIHEIRVQLFAARVRADLCRIVTDPDREMVAKS